MRKFKFIGDEEDYNVPVSGKSFKFGRVYAEDFRGIGCMSLVGWYATGFPQDWEEVFDEEDTQVTNLHKDTDLGYFAGVAMQTLPPPKEYIGEKETYDSYSEWAKRCVTMAMTLINQLNKETK